MVTLVYHKNLINQSCIASKYGVSSTKSLVFRSNRITINRWIVTKRNTIAQLKTAAAQESKRALKAEEALKRTETQCVDLQKQYVDLLTVKFPSAGSSHEKWYRERPPVWERGNGPYAIQRKPERFHEFIETGFGCISLYDIFVIKFIPSHVFLVPSGKLSRRPSDSTLRQIVIIIIVRIIFAKERYYGMLICCEKISTNPFLDTVGTICFHRLKIIPFWYLRNNNNKGVLIMWFLENKLGITRLHLL